ncbi:5-formyltetrahydrofolate cyclo-ligase [Candidatus Pelagibacter sp.]|nr:5-formyltetrahydrofolate cyclo-ligase [Candidatus Pelagibacter sp.]
MKTDSEKEKKLTYALNKLKNLDLKNPTLKIDLANLNAQKNQLEIEKKEIEEKYQNLVNDHTALNQKLEDISRQRIDEQKKETEFSEKIDELNQETDTLLEEIDKWQM